MFLRCPLICLLETVDKQWGPLLFVVSKIYTEKVLAGIMDNLQIHNAISVISVIGLTLVALLGFFWMISVVVCVVRVLGKDLNYAVDFLLTLE